MIAAPPPSPRKRALVTGAGGGLGREIAHQFAARGCAVVVADINGAGAEATTVRCRELGGEASAFVSDLTKTGAPERVVAVTAETWGGIDILVNNAGFGAIEPFLEMT